MLQDTIEVVITPRDVLTSEFSNCNDCAFAKAVKRKTKSENVRLGTSTVFINGVKYVAATPFDYNDFDKAYSRAMNGERFKIKKTLKRVKDTNL